MRLEIRYVSEFHYRESVRESHNLLRACPLATPRQQLVSYEVTVEPAARIHSYTDFWGTRVDAFGIRVPHSHLTVIADSVVESEAPLGVEGPVPLAAADDAFRSRNWVYLQPTAHTSWRDSLAAAARDLARPADDYVDAVRRVAGGAAARLEYAPGATYVGVDVNDVFEAGKGVCQDFAHLTLAMLRSLDVPCRYVSGYFYAADQSVGDEPQDTEIDVQTHAWVEVAVPGHGWWALDPTNDQEAGPRHVKIGHGRDYDDVPPLRGVFHGPPDHDLDVSVKMSRDQMAAYAGQQ